MLLIMFIYCLCTAVRPAPGPAAGSTIELRRPEAPAQQQQQARTDIGFTRPPAQTEEEVGPLGCLVVVCVGVHDETAAAEAADASALHEAAARCMRRAAAVFSGYSVACEEWFRDLSSCGSSTSSCVCNNGSRAASC